MDGNDSVHSNIPNNDTTDEDSSDDSDEHSSYDSDDEVDPEPIPTIFQPDEGHTVFAGQPQKFDVQMNTNFQPSPLPLCLMLNCRSACKRRIIYASSYTLSPRRSHFSLRRGSETKRG